MQIHPNLGASPIHRKQSSAPPESDRTDSSLKAASAATETRWSPPGRSTVELLRYAHALVPTLRDRATETEAARMLPAETIREMKKAGLFGLLQPVRFGGLELGFDVLMEIAIELGRGCGSTAWVLIVLNSGWLVAGYPEEAQHDVWGHDRGAVIGNVLAPSMDVSEVTGGYRLSGSWSFASGIDHADWEVLSGMTYSNAGLPEIRLFLLHHSNYEIIDDWRAVGLSGTGSKTVVVKDVIVPYHRSVLLSDFRSGTQPGGRVHSNPLYRMPIGIAFPLSLPSSVIGLARGAYDCWREWAANRLTRGTQRIAEKASVQFMLGAAAAEIDSAEAILRRDMSEAVRAQVRGEPFTAVHRARNRRDGAYAIKLCVRAVDRLFAASGAHGLYDASPIHRAWRDVHAAAAHVGFRWDDAAVNFGKFEFGLGTDNSFFD